MGCEKLKKGSIAPLILALTAVFVFGAMAVFSKVEGSYPPPTNLTATTQSVGSGQIKLAWQKPSSSEVIGYNIYKDGVYLNYVIGANTLSYYDTGLPPSTSFDYFIKAVYLGVAEADLPASNTVSAVSPAYCSGGAGTCVGVNPFVAGLGRTIIDLKGKKLDGSHQKSEVFTVNLPAGRYQVYAHSFDAYPGRASVAQSNEQWFLSLLASGKEVVKTNSTADLNDGQDEIGSTQVIETELILAEPINQIRAVHAGVNGGSFDDVGLSAVMFVSMQDSAGCLLVINKTADREVVSAGDEITYTITVTNKGAANCTGGGNYVYDKMPSQLQFVGETHTSNSHIYDPAYGAYYPDSHTVWWIVTTPLVPGEVAVLTLTGRVKDSITSESCDGDLDGGLIENEVYITNNEYSGRTVSVYSNNNALICDYDGGDGDGGLNPPTVAASTGQSCGGSIALLWTAVAGAESYQLYRDGSALPIYSGSALSYVDFVTPETTHQYYVVAVTGASVSENSNTASAKASAACQPFTPDLSSISCEPDRRSVVVGEQVRWTAVPVPDSSSYEYQWSGDEGLTGGTKSVVKIYSTAGVKSASVDVVGVGSAADCSSTVNVGIQPIEQEF